MPIESPKIDKRNQQEIVQQVKDLALYYCPEMASIERDNQADALIQIFSRMMETIIQRLNKVPDKNFLTFMDLVGVRLSEPRIARTPLTFTMTKKASQYGSIPAGTQVAAEIKDKEPVVFETEKELTVISPKLIKVVSLSPNDDKWTDHSPVLIDKEKKGTEELFEGKKLIPHRIYLGHKKLFSFKETATIIVNINLKSEITEKNSWEVKWYYYKADSQDPIPLYVVDNKDLKANLLNSGDIIFNNVSGISEKTLVELGKEADKQKSWTNYWIFAELNTPIPKDNLPEIATIKASVMIAPASSAGTGTISSEGKNVTGDKTIFTKELKNDGFIISAGQTRKIVTIKSDVSLTVDSAFDPVLPAGTNFSFLSAGKGTISSNGTNVTGNGTAFSEELKVGDSITAAGQTRIVIDIESNEKLTVDSAFYPVLGSGTSYSYKSPPPIDKAFFNNIPLDLTKDFYPFGETPKFNYTFYIGSKEVFSKEKADIFINIILSTGLELDTEDITLSWEFWDGKSWMELGKSWKRKDNQDNQVHTGSVSSLQGADFNDTTGAFTQEGHVTFKCPKIEAKEISGEENYWIRIRIVSGNYGNEATAIERKTAPYPGKGMISSITTGTGTISSDGTKITGTGTIFSQELKKGDAIEAAGQTRKIVAINSDVSLIVDLAFDPALSAGTSFNFLSTTITGFETAFTQQLTIGDSIIADNQIRTVTDIKSDTSLIVDSAFDPALPKRTSFEYAKTMWFYKPATFKPPSISTLTLSYRFEPPKENLEVVLTYNNFVYQDKTNNPDSFKPFQPSEDKPAIYLAFDQSIATLPVTIFFPLLEKSAGAKMTPVSLKGTGTISGDGTEITGTGTIFSQELKKGDAIEAAGQMRTVTDILSDTILTIDFAFDPPLVARTNFSYFIFASLIWEYWTGKDWKEMMIQEDNTRNLTNRELIQFLAPADLTKRQCFKFKKEFDFEAEYYWIRARLEKGNYVDFPRLGAIYTNTVWAYNKVTVLGEILGSSNGKPSQVFKLSRSPILSGQKVLVKEISLTEEERRTVTIEEEEKDDAGNITGFWVLWIEKKHFYSSEPNSRHYVIDRNRGEITFGDGERGMIPTAGENNIKCDYKSGGGDKGNVAAEKITKIRKSFPYIDSVTNPEAADGGGNQEDLERIRERGPQTLKHRDRAVTYEDFEWLVKDASPKVAKAKCLPTKDPSLQFKAGWVTIIIVPETDDPKPLPTQELISGIKENLKEKTSTYLMELSQINLIGPGYIQVGVEASIQFTSIAEAKTIEGRVMDNLKQFFHPLRGGPEKDPGKKGWDFGRDVYISEVYEVIENTEGVDHVENLSLHANIQIYKYTLKGYITPSVSYPKNSSVTSIDNRIVFSLAEKLSENMDIDTLAVVGFKEGDVVLLSHNGNRKSLVLKSVSNDSYGDIIECEPVSTDSEYPVGSTVETSDKRIKSFILNEIPANSNISLLKVAILEPDDKIYLRLRDDPSKTESSEIKDMSTQVETIFVDDNYLVYSGEHAINKNRKEEPEFPYLINIRSKEIHDLNNLKQNCHLDDILRGHRKFVRTLDKINGYDYCRWCFGAELSKR